MSEATFESQLKALANLLQGQDVVVYSLDGSVVETKTGPRLHLRNDTGRPLNHAWLLGNTASHM